MLKKIIAFLLVVSLTVAVAIGGTLAYLTDRDSEANVFTVGDVKIDLSEDFNQGSALVPGVKIEKEPTITNTGINSAWVWAEIAIPSALNDTTSASKNALHFNMSAASVADGQWNWWDGADYSEGTYFIEKRQIDGVNYDVYVVQYETALQPGDTTTHPVMYQVYLDPHIDIDPDGNWAWVENGVVTPIAWNTTANGNPVIYVSAYAIQTEGFDTVYAAYDAYRTQWTTDAGVNNGVEYGAPATFTTVSTAEELTAALAAGGNVVLTSDVALDKNEVISVPAGAETTLNMNGHTLSGSSDTTGKNKNMITVKGDLTINNGTLTQEHVGTNMKWDNSVSVLSVEGGTLTLGSDVVINNIGGSDMAYGVDVNSTLGESVLNINGATIKSPYIAVRLFNNHQTQKAIVNMNGGTVDGTKRDIWAQLPSANAKPENAVVNFADGITYATETQSTGSIIYTIN